MGGLTSQSRRPPSQLHAKQDEQSLGRRKGEEDDTFFRISQRRGSIVSRVIDWWRLLTGRGEDWHVIDIGNETLEVLDGVLTDTHDFEQLRKRIELVWAKEGRISSMRHIQLGQRGYLVAAFRKTEITLPMRSIL